MIHVSTCNNQKLYQAQLNQNTNIFTNNFLIIEDHE